MTGDTADRVVYVVILAYNGEKCIGACLKSLMKSNYPVRIVVLDNASTDRTREVIREFEDVRVLPQPKNLGFGLACNIGIGHALEAGADYVFLLNQDVCIGAETVGHLVHAAQGHPDYGILSPLHLSKDGTALDNRFKRRLATVAADMLSDRYGKGLREVYPVESVNGAAWLIPAACLKQVGGFDPLFFMYGEDGDFVNRTSFHGWKVGIVPQAEMAHSRHFHKQAAPLSFSEEVLRRANTHRRYLTVHLKHPSYSFIRHFLLQAIEDGAVLLQSVIRRDWTTLSSTLLAMLMVIPRLPKIWLNRRCCKRGKGAFLAWNDQASA